MNNIERAAQDVIDALDKAGEDRRQVVAQMLPQDSDIIRMAREAGFWMTSDEEVAVVKRFAALVRAGERDKWMDRTAILIRGEREACAKVCEDNAADLSEGDWDSACINCADHIRARGETE